MRMKPLNPHRGKVPCYTPTPPALSAAAKRSSQLSLLPVGLLKSHTRQNLCKQFIKHFSSQGLSKGMFIRATLGNELEAQ